MALITQSPRGTQDVLPSESYRWHYIENILKSVCEKYGYRELRVPTFEHTELFARGVGDTTDVVNKEMYTFNDRGGRSVTLRPEGTAGAARLLLQGGVLSGPLPVRAYYMLSCFRYEKPQAGRLREFHQLGIELFGAPTPDADFEVISVAAEILRTFGIEGIRLEINSIGCPQCRRNYHEALRSYFESKKDGLCGTCLDRLSRNPMRILDCKSPECQGICKDAPTMTDFLCEDCRLHFDTLRSMLDDAGMEYTVNPAIVRGLDYYSRTVFEFIHSGAGAQGTVCGGGRYDGLTELLGGSPCSGIGFGMGLERLLSVLDSEGIEIPEPDGPLLFFCSIGEAARKQARLLCAELKAAGISAQYDLNERSVKAQMKFADKLHACNTIVLGEDEVSSGRAVIRSMIDKSEKTVRLDAESIAALLK